MGHNDFCSWDDHKQQLNIINHGYDFAEMSDICDGRFCVIREDRRRDYGELRYNMLVELRSRIINVTFTPRNNKMHLISVRPASREERQVYHDKNAKR